MPEVSPMIAVKKFFENGTNRPLTNPEFIAFWKSLTEEEKQSFGESAAKQLGLVLQGTNVS